MICPGHLSTARQHNADTTPFPRDRTPGEAKEDARGYGGQSLYFGAAGEAQSLGSPRALALASAPSTCSSENTARCMAAT